MPRGLAVVCIAVSLCAATMEPVWAHLPVDVSYRHDDGLLDLDFTPVQIGIYAGYPFQLFTGSADVYGVAAGVLNLRQRSAVVSAALENGIERNFFLQAGLISTCEVNYALDVGILCVTGRNLGISAGIFNGESNFGERNDDPYPWWLPGLQIGLFNIGGGIQIGLLNYNPQGFLPFSPVLNFPL